MRVYEQQKDNSLLIFVIRVYGNDYFKGNARTSKFVLKYGINIKKSEALKVLNKKIQCDVCWNRNIFQCLIFLRREKLFWSTSLHHLHPKDNGIQLEFVGRCLNVYFDVNSGKISIHSLKHRCNLACVSLFYHYDNEFGSNE